MKKVGKIEKAEKKVKDKVIEDKTFGLKNKNKSSKVQKYIQSVKNQVYNKDLTKEEMEKWAKAKEEKKKENENGALMGFLLKNLQKVEEAKVAAA